MICQVGSHISTYFFEQFQVASSKKIDRDTLKPKNFGLRNFEQGILKLILSLFLDKFLKHFGIKPQAINNPKIFHSFDTQKPFRFLDFLLSESHRIFSFLLKMELATMLKFWNIFFLEQKLWTIKILRPKFLVLMYILDN